MKRASSIDSATSEQAQDLWARRLMSHLDRSALSHDTAERLRVTRLRAHDLHQQVLKQAQVPELVGAESRWTWLAHAGQAAGQASFGGGHHWLHKMALALPFVVLLLGLPLINQIQDERRIQELAEVDSSLLSDDLPINAYSDPGFVQFLRAQATVLDSGTTE